MTLVMRNLSGRRDGAESASMGQKTSPKTKQRGRAEALASNTRAMLIQEHTLSDLAGHGSYPAQTAQRYTGVRAMPERLVETPTHLTMAPVRTAP
jgi:hypothetical protein